MAVVPMHAGTPGLPVGAASGLAEDEAGTRTAIGPVGLRPDLSRMDLHQPRPLRDPGNAIGFLVRFASCLTDGIVRLLFDAPIIFDADKVAQSGIGLSGIAPPLEFSDGFAFRRSCQRVNGISPFVFRRRERAAAAPSARSARARRSP